MALQGFWRPLSRAPAVGPMNLLKPLIAGGPSDSWEPLKLMGPLRLLVGPQIAGAGGPFALHNLHNPFLYAPEFCNDPLAID